LSGTPLTSPFDLWSQFNVVDPAILGERFVPFKTKYGIFETKFFGPRAVKVVSGYRELDDLKRRVDPHSSWRTFDETFPGNPGVLPLDTAYFELSPEYQRAYDELKREYILLLERGEVIVQNPLTMLLRLQQVARGFVNTTEDGVQPIPGENNALKRLLHEVSERHDEKVVIWCRFTPDVDLVLDALKKAGVVSVRHDGAISQEERDKNREDFQGLSVVRVVVGTPSTGGVGKDFSAGSTVIFYSHSFNLIERIQAFDRVRGVNQTRPVQQVDICALGTVDERCLSLLKSHVDVVSRIQDRSTLLHVLRSADSEDSSVAAEPSSTSVDDASYSEDEAASVLESMLKKES
jgi:SNF2 family DNA or RNA helicase